MNFCKLTLATDLKGIQRRIPNLIDAQMKKAMHGWHQNILPKHFKHGAAQRYKYQPRTKRYQNRKRRMGSPPALVYSGESKRQLSMPLRITGKGIIKGRFQASNNIKYFWMRPKNHPNKPDEMKRLRKDEQDQLAEAALQGVTGEIEKMRGTANIVVQ
ncbi:MAG: hypothetical protein JXA82_18105 [Sedimentisphaerales bacterium]|nr:hypothetical protein [Sedimentisphaerales bacterium]